MHAKYRPLHEASLWKVQSQLSCQWDEQNFRWPCHQAMHNIIKKVQKIISNLTRGSSRVPGVHISHDGVSERSMHSRIHLYVLIHGLGETWMAAEFWLAWYITSPWFQKLHNLIWGGELCEIMYLERMCLWWHCTCLHEMAIWDSRIKVLRVAKQDWHVHIPRHSLLASSMAGYEVQQSAHNAGTLSETEARSYCWAYSPGPQGHNTYMHKPPRQLWIFFFYLFVRPIKDRVLEVEMALVPPLNLVFALAVRNHECWAIYQCFEQVFSRMCKHLLCSREGPHLCTSRKRHQTSQIVFVCDTTHSQSNSHINIHRAQTCAESPGNPQRGIWALR